MNKYKFKLDKLLNIRKEKEEEAKKEFIEAQIKLNKTQEKLSELKDKFVKYSSANSEESVVERKIRNNYLNSLAIQIKEFSIKLENNKIEIEEKRKEVIARQIDRKTVERLKEKGKEVFIKEQDDIEQKANDEFALFGYIRNHGGR